MLEIGELCYALNSVTYHNFEDGILGFCQRFIRYGQGNKMISNLYAIDLMPKMFSAKKNNFLNQTLARLQYACLLWGYITYSGK
ncbi:MAG: hypothetical protein GDA48_25490 [Hormoscilla sp. GM102CHS1]|nr:hypothetical protein [Hormoscilla sp. GM102CHS1]